jgi:hypothetical protein
MVGAPRDFVRVRIMRSPMRVSGAFKIEFSANPGPSVPARNMRTKVAKDMHALHDVNITRYHTVKQYSVVSEFSAQRNTFANH